MKRINIDEHKQLIDEIILLSLKETIKKLSKVQLELINIDEEVIRLESVNNTKTT
tara:strand:- start:1084 stop:1248 length:165 start_codon:yes stop_codon:yes gene_type:complete